MGCREEFRARRNSRGDRARRRCRWFRANLLVWIPLAEFLVLAYKKEECRENQVNENDHKNGHNHRARGRAANLFGTGASGETFKTAYSGDGDAEHNALNESADNITEKERVNRGGDIAGEGEVGLRDAKERATENAHGVGPNSETRQHDGHGDEFGSHQEMDRADGHGFEGIDFFGDLHGADFGGESGAGTADYYDGCNQRAKFAGHGNGNGSGYIADGAEAAKFVSGLESQNQANKKSDKREDGEGANANIESLRDRPLKADWLTLKRGDEGVVGSLATKGGQRTNVSKAVRYRAADLREKLHCSFRIA